MSVKSRVARQQVFLFFYFVIPIRNTNRSYFKRASIFLNLSAQHLKKRRRVRMKRKSQRGGEEGGEERGEERRGGRRGGRRRGRRDEGGDEERR